MAEFAPIIVCLSHSLMRWLSHRCGSDWIGRRDCIAYTRGASGARKIRYTSYTKITLQFHNPQLDEKGPGRNVVGALRLELGAGDARGKRHVVDRL